MKTYPFGKVFSVMLILLLAFFAGRGVAELVSGTESENVRQEAQNTPAVQSESGMQNAPGMQKTSGIQNSPGTQSAPETPETQGAKEMSELQDARSASALALPDNWPFNLNSPMMPGTENWGLGFGTQGAKPAGNASVTEMKNYNAYYMAGGEEQKIYLTFDCGYENGNTEKILDALKKHNAPGTFFVVGHYLESSPELVKRMVKEGHAVGNHTYHHPDMSKISDESAFRKEMDDVRSLYREVTGQEMSMYYRPPQGKYNTENLKMAQELGYATFFWSLAYVDWNVDDQPTREEAFSKLTSRVHPGAVVLLHNTSKTNGEILDELLTKWEEMGYTFGTLDEVIASVVDSE